MPAGKRRHFVRIHRSTETRASRGRTNRTWAAVGQAWAEIRAPRRSLAMTPAGERPDGAMEAEFLRSADVKTGDVVAIVHGTDAGTTWRVVAADPYSRRGSIITALDLFTEPLT